MLQRYYVFKNYSFKKRRFSGIILVKSSKTSYRLIFHPLKHVVKLLISTSGGKRRSILSLSDYVCYTKKQDSE